MRVRNIVFLAEKIAQWAAGIIPYLIYLISLTPTPVVNVASNVNTNLYSEPMTTATPYVAPSATVITQESTVSSHKLGSLDDWLAQSNWPSNSWATVKRIVMCESGGNPAIVSPSGYVGLMQVAPWFWGYPSSNPVEQLNQGYEVYKKQGWGAWQCY